MERTEIRLTGSGGQGIIMLGVILADCAIQTGHNAIQSQSYGPEARGGASKCEVIMDENDINFPKVQRPNLLLALTQDAANKYAHNLNSECLIVLDETVNLEKNPGTEKIVKLPILSTARDKVGKEITANIVALGALNHILKSFEPDTLFEVILEHVPKGTEVLNRRAFDAGHDIAKEIYG